MFILKICLTAVLSVAELFILTKIMGKRQLSQLSLFDYINGITIGSIAAEMATSPINLFWQPAAAMLVYGLLAVAFSFISDKSISFRRKFVGQTLILMDNGKLCKRNFKKAKLDINEFLTQCRISGYFNLDELQTVILETNGQLSFLPKSETRPLYPKDIGMKLSKETTLAVVISDGKVLQRNLASIGKNEIWLREQLKEGGYPPIFKIFLAMGDENGIYVYEDDKQINSKDAFI